MALVRTEGMAFAAMSTAQKIGAGLASAIVGGLLSMGHFDASLSVQPDSAITAIRISTLVLPLVFMIVITVISFIYDLDKKMPQILEDLKKRHEEAER